MNVTQSLLVLIAGLLALVAGKALGDGGVLLSLLGLVGFWVGVYLTVRALWRARHDRSAA